MSNYPGTMSQFDNDEDYKDVKIDKIMASINKLEEKK